MSETLASALDQAFETERSPGQSTAEPVAEREAPVTETVAPTTEPATEAVAAKTDEKLEETGDPLLDRLTPEQIAEIKADPKLRALYKGLMSSYTPKMQALAEQQKLWDALNNPDSRQEAVAALARAVGLQIQPTDAPQREQAAAAADKISDEWSKVVGPEAAEMLRPLIEKTALAAVQGTLEPMKQAADFVYRDAASRQSEAQVSQFRALAQKEGWELNPQIEAKMAQLGLQYRPAQPIQTVEQGVEFMKYLYRMADDGQESRIEKRILERMKKASEEAEPGRGVTSTGREKRTNITKDMDLMESLDVAFNEAVEGR